LRRTYVSRPEAFMNRRWRVLHGRRDPTGGWWSRQVSWYHHDDM